MFTWEIYTLKEVITLRQAHPHPPLTRLPLHTSHPPLTCPPLTHPCVCGCVCVCTYIYVCVCVKEA
jgi:hypothetical protein